MKPLRIFIFFAAVAGVLLLVAFIFPRQGITIAPGLHLRFVELSDLSASPTAERDLAVKQMVASSGVTEDPESGFDPSALSEAPLLLPGEAPSSLDLPAILPANSDSLKQAVRFIEFGEEGPELMAPFFKKMKGLKEGRVVRTRILHFGDSQIENDRMTALIRFRLQEQFGGSGTGLVQAIPLYSEHMAYRYVTEGSWLRYTYFGTRDTTLSHNAYGIMGAFSSVPLPDQGSWPSLHYSFNASRRSGTPDRVKVFLHSYVENGSIALLVNGSVCDTIRHIPAGFSVADFRQHTPIRELSLSLCLPEGGRIYGISFESYRGLQVDNIAMRGESGLIFTRMNREQQLGMMEYLEPGLLLLQYGGNVVPYIDAGYYQRRFTQELLFLRELCPGVPVIVIGPSDMSLKEKGGFVTYPGIEPVRDALRSSAMATGFAFWDLYEAMGGRNSMPSFVHADPPLALPDYVHFTALGVNLVAEMFYHSLMAEYDRYLTQTR
jgi:hypothetical protein